MTRPLAVTMGDPAGIGGELTLAAWGAARDGRHDLPVFFAIDDRNRLLSLAKTLGWDVPIALIATPEEAAAAFTTALPVMDCPLAALATSGLPRLENAPSVIASIKAAVDFALQQRIGGIVTNPIHKATLLASGFAYPGHTEFLAALADVAQPAMMLVIEGLRVVPVTIHLPIAEVSPALSTAKIMTIAKITAAALKAEFGIALPRLAVAALNPHAGEDGAIGDEEIAIIAPAIRALQDFGVAASGPYPADTLFHKAARENYDAVLTMYHDQALIPLKTLDFWSGVNVTLGLPFVRTSPDHGTAFAIAGKGIARPDSFFAALKLAARLANHRFG